MNTSCLAHAEITICGNNILRICGHLDHNQRCQKAEFCRIPPIPVHPSVYTIAFAQLLDGTTFSDIRQKNRDLFKAKAYKDSAANLDSCPYRWILTHNDSRSLYRQYNRMKGVTITQASKINVDDWLDPTSDKFNPTLAHAIRHKGTYPEVPFARPVQCVFREYTERNRIALVYGDPLVWTHY
ncbi:hypothetical protein B0H13DRAFT_2556439 [Mycena leptocephala]|nr:hypothetical protein B0H13DRAFT_2556439 [Mycena leptocephala]